MNTNFLGETKWLFGQCDKKQFLTNNAMKQKSIFLISLLIILCGCASTTVTSPKAIGTRGELGIDALLKDSQFKIIRIYPKSVAEQNSLMWGDEIVSINGTKIDDRESTLHFLDIIGISPDQFIDLNIRRDGVEKKFKIKLGSKELYPQDLPFLEMQKYIWVGDKISMAIFIEEVTSTGYSENSETAQMLDKWKQVARTTLLTRIEQDWLNIFSAYKNFKIVDRSSIDKALVELQFQMTGAVSADEVKKIGKMVGASHICLVSLNRSKRTNQEYTDTFFYRIIDIESGTVIHSSQYSVNYNN